MKNGDVAATLIVGAELLCAGRTRHRYPRLHESFDTPRVSESPSFSDGIDAPRAGPTEKSRENRGLVRKATRGLFAPVGREE